MYYSINIYKIAIIKAISRCRYQNFLFSWWLENDEDKNYIFISCEKIIIKLNTAIKTFRSGRDHTDTYNKKNTARRKNTTKTEATKGSVKVNAPRRFLATYQIICDKGYHNFIESGPPAVLITSHNYLSFVIFFRICSHNMTLSNK